LKVCGRYLFDFVALTALQLMLLLPIIHVMATTAERLAEVRTQISLAITGSEWSNRDGSSFKRQSLADLRELEKELVAQLADELASGGEGGMGGGVIADERGLGSLDGR
jgi:hypothetical protein